MRISSEQVREVATLARLGLREEELEALRGQLEAILGYVGQLAELDLSAVEGTSHPLPVDCPTRADQSRPCPSAGRLLEPAPRRQDDFFAVPRILPD